MVASSSRHEPLRIRSVYDCTLGYGRSVTPVQSLCAFSRTATRRPRRMEGPDTRLSGPSAPTGSAAVQPGSQEPLAYLGALAAVRLGLAEQVGDLGVLVAFRVLDVALQAQRGAQARLDVPDEVVVLVRRAGRTAGLRAAGHSGL